MRYLLANCFIICCLISSAQSPQDADIDGDNIVGVQDLTFLLSAYNSTFTPMPCEKACAPQSYEFFQPTVSNPFFQNYVVDEMPDFAHLKIEMLWDQLANPVGQILVSIPQGNFEGQEVCFNYNLFGAPPGIYAVEFALQGNPDTYNPDDIESYVQFYSVNGSECINSIIIWRYCNGAWHEYN